MLSVIERGERHGAVEMVRRRDDHRIQLLEAEQALVVRDRVRDPEALRHDARLLRIVVTDPEDLDVFHPRQGGKMIDLRDGSDPDESEAGHSYCQRGRSRSNVGDGRGRSREYRN